MSSIKKEGIGYKIFTIVNIFLLLLIGLVMLLPYLHVVAKAFNDAADTTRGGIAFFPRKFSMENMGVLFSDTSIYHAFFITLLKVGLGTVSALFVQMAAGYTLAIPNLPYKKGVLILFVIPMFFNGGVIPTYVLYSKLHILNTFWVYILPGLFNFYNIVIIRSYIMSNVPFSLQEAALIDGLTWTGIFARIVIPLSKPIIATVVLWLAVGHWNDWTVTLYYVNNEKLYTLAYKLMQLLKESERLSAMIQEAVMSGKVIKAGENKITADSVVSAQIVLTTVPIIIVYPFLQKYFIKGAVLGAVKE